MEFQSIKKLLCLLIFCTGAFTASAQKIKAGDIRKILEDSNIIQTHFTGFALYDEESDKMIYELNADKYFVPASNTKLFTFYTALNMLGDSIPGLRYIITGDSLVFWGTGDPSFLHPDLNSNRVFNFLKNSDKKLFYSATNFQGQPYHHYYIELNPMPVGDNPRIRDGSTTQGAGSTIEKLELVLQKKVGLSEMQMPDTAATLFSISSDSL